MDGKYNSVYVVVNGDQNHFEVKTEVQRLRWQKTLKTRFYLFNKIA